MKKRTKVIIFVVLGIIILAVAGFFIGKYYAVNYAFDKSMTQIMEAMKNPSVQEKIDGVLATSGENTENADGTSVSGNEPKTPGSDGNITGTSAESSDGNGGSAQKPVSEKTPEEMTDKEVISVVMKDSSLMSKMSGMVTYSDKERVIAMVLSNFTPQEISHYSSLAAKGLDSATRSELISIARSRLTSAQLSECMQIAYKYADEIRPYLKKN